MIRLALLFLIACIVLPGCRDAERNNLKAENHRLQRELRVAKNRVTELENEILSTALLYAPPPVEPMDPNATRTGGVGQRGPVTGPPVASALAQFRRPHRAGHSTAPEPKPSTEAVEGLPPAVQTGQALSLAPESHAAAPAPRELVPMSPEQLEALQGG